jgi:hypothetical protein
MVFGKRARGEGMGRLKEETRRRRGGGEVNKRRSRNRHNCHLSTDQT